MANPQSSFATDTRIVHMCNLVAECGRNRLSGCYATSGQKAKLSQASQPFYSHSQRSRIPICVDSSQKLDSESRCCPLLLKTSLTAGHCLLQVGSQVGSCTRCRWFPHCYTAQKIFACRLTPDLVIKCVGEQEMMVNGARVRRLQGVTSLTSPSMRNCPNHFINVFSQKKLRSFSSFK